MAKIVVTGGLGFVGSHLVDAYLAAGDHVTVIDSAVAAVVDGSEYDAHPRCTVIRASVEDFFGEGGSVEGADRVIHAAAHVGPAGILRYAGEIGPAIVSGTECVIRACLAADAQLCVFSSAEVYGRSGLLGEGDDLRVPIGYNARIEYAVAKALTEVMTVNSLHRGLQAFVIRPFNVVGARQSQAGGFVMPTFVQQALSGQPITVFDTGQQVRSFTSASDLSRFLTHYWDDALASDANIFNIGNPSNRSTIEALAIRVRELLNSSSTISLVDGKTIHGPMYEEAESFEKVPVLGAALELGWEPRVVLDDLILETASYYQASGDYRDAREKHQSLYAAS